MVFLGIKLDHLHRNISTIAELLPLQRCHSDHAQACPVEVERVTHGFLIDADGSRYVESR